MKKVAFIFPGQGSQTNGMGKDFFENSDIAKEMIKNASDRLGFNFEDLLFNESENLGKTEFTQPAILLVSCIALAVFKEKSDIKPEFVLGHSLGEFSALVANETLKFEDGLKLVSQRAQAMQKACDSSNGTMAAVLGLENEIVEQTCKSVKGVVVAANYNCPGQLVISGAVDAIQTACEQLKEKGARRALVLPVGGAFHSPLMAPAREQLSAAIENTQFHTPCCAIYQNVTATPILNETEIKNNLISQLTSPVKWTQSVQQMIADGGAEFIEVGPGNVLQGLVRKINREMETKAATIEN